MRLGVDRRVGVEGSQAVGSRRAGHELGDPLRPGRRCAANGLKPDSAYSWAASRSIGTFQRSAAPAIGSWKRGGTKLGRPWLIRP